MSSCFRDVELPGDVLGHGETLPVPDAFCLQPVAASAQSMTTHASCAEDHLPGMSANSVTVDTRKLRNAKI